MSTQNTNSLRALVRGTYDLQGIRIQMGNRIVANFKVTSGQEPSASEENMDADAKKLLKEIRASYDLITDGVIDNLPTRKKFKAQGVIDTHVELVLVATYLQIERDEKRHFARFAGVLEGFPIWTDWMQEVRGVGPVMAAVIISEFDPAKAKYPSSFWAYAGLDVTKDGTGRSRRKEHLVTKEYTTKEGEIAERSSITFNPWLKTKLIGVLAGSFLKLSRYYTDEQIELRKGMTESECKKMKPTGPCKSEYAQIYYNYRRRLESNPAHDDKSKGHRNNMAKRYMIKMFLIDLHMKWRELEGLPVHKPYSEGKLGLSHEKLETQIAKARQGAVETQDVKTCRCVQETQSWRACQADEETH